MNLPKPGARRFHMMQKSAAQDAVLRSPKSQQEVSQFVSGRAVHDQKLVVGGAQVDSDRAKTGVTGARRTLPGEVAGFLRSLKEISPVPVAVGFGISNPEQARAVARHADGVIVGSALINRLRDGKPLFPFVRALRSALNG